jgi:sugar phosphate isomerase/epimerase
MKLSQVGAQLYTVRDHLQGPAAFARSVQRLKAIGYAAVELVHSETVSDSEIAKICAEAGVAVAAAHEIGKENLFTTVTT